METIEPPASFCDRVRARTGVELAAIPDVPPEALISGQILCARGRTRVVTTGYPVVREDADGEYEAYTSFGVVERDNDLPAYAVAQWRVYTCTTTGTFGGRWFPCSEWASEAEARELCAELEARELTVKYNKSSFVALARGDEARYGVPT